MEIVSSIVQARVGESGSEWKEAEPEERKFTPLHFGFVVRLKVDTYNGRLLYIKPQQICEYSLCNRIVLELKRWKPCAETAIQSLRLER